MVKLVKLDITLKTITNFIIKTKRKIGLKNSKILRKINSPLPPDNCCNTKTINVLTKQEELLIDLISKVENPELKSEHLKRLKKVISEGEIKHEKTPPPKISLSSTLERFNSSKKEITLQDLQLEVKNVKREIITLKKISHELQNENYEIKQDLISLMK